MAAPHGAGDKGDTMDDMDGAMAGAGTGVTADGAAVGAAGAAAATESAAGGAAAGDGRIGLVLEGGAMRGMFTAGVLDVLMRAQVECDAMIGVSAGAALGCNYKSRQIGRALRYNKRFCADPRYAGVRSWLTSGDVYNVHFAYGVVPFRIDPFDERAFAANPMGFWCVATDADTGEPAYRSMPRTMDMPFLRASASIPIASRPVSIDGRAYVDGGVSDPVPLAFFEKQGFARTIVVLTQPDDYRKTPLPHMRAIRLALHRHPRLAEAIERRPGMYNEEIEYVRERERAGAALVIRPAESLNIGAVCKDPAELQRVYDCGVHTATDMLPRVLEFVGRDHVGRRDVPYTTRIIAPQRSI